MAFLIGLAVSPLQPNVSPDGRLSPYEQRAAGVRLVVRLFSFLSWMTAALWWTGIAALCVKPAVTDEAAYGRHDELLSPIITSFLAGQWEWSAPRLDELKGGPLFLLADMVSSTLATWSSQMESGFAPSVVQAIIFGPPFAIARSMSKMWSDAL